MDGTAATSAHGHPRPAHTSAPVPVCPPYPGPCTCPRGAHSTKREPTVSPAPPPPTLRPVTRPQLHGTWPSVWLTAGVPLTSCEGPGQKTDRDPDARWETRPL